MTQTRATRIAALLLQTSEAHQTYQHLVLKGNDDPDWAKWYALYIIEHDWRQLINQAWTFGQLSQFLIQTYEANKTDYPSLSWIDCATQQILVALYPEEITFKTHRHPAKKPHRRVPRSPVEPEGINSNGAKTRHSSSVKVKGQSLGA